jgi:hypothetical protein
MEEYADQFEELYYQISIHNSGYDPVFFISQFISGLKPDIRVAVQTQVPNTLHRAVMLAKLHQRVQDHSKGKFQKSLPVTKPQRAPAKQISPPSNMWRERPKSDYCKANGLCYWCSEKYDPANAEVCTKRPKAQLNALFLHPGCGVICVCFGDRLPREIDRKDSSGSKTSRARERWRGERAQGIPSWPCIAGVAEGPSWSGRC